MKFYQFSNRFWIVLPSVMRPTWAARTRTETKLRGTIRMGELVADLDKSAGGANPKATLPSDGKSKSEAIADANLSKSEAYRAQDLAGGTTKSQRGTAAARAAADLRPNAGIQTSQRWEV